MQNNELKKLLQPTTKPRAELYFDLQECCSKLYSNNTVVFLQNGFSYELYCSRENHNHLSTLKSVAELLNLTLQPYHTDNTNKDSDLFIATFSQEDEKKNIQKILQTKHYTIVFIGENFTDDGGRFLKEVLSPAIHLDYTVNTAENYIVSLVTHKHNGVYSVGFSAIDVATSRCYLYEATGTAKDRFLALDAIYSLLYTYTASEIVLTSQDSTDEVMKYLEIPKHLNYHINHQLPEITEQNTLFEEAFELRTLLSAVEHLSLEATPMASESLAILLNFIALHDSDAAKKLSPPKLIETKKHLHLGNNALEQLGIITRDSRHFSLLKLMDKTSTPFGSRMLKQRLLNPITDKKELTRRYDFLEKVKNHIYFFEKKLQAMYDLEYLTRRVLLSRASHSELSNISDTLTLFLEVLEYIKKHNILEVPFDKYELKKIIATIKESNFLQLFKKHYSQLLGTIVEYVAELDVALSSAKVAKLYKHNRPTIVTTKEDENFMQILKLRHPLIEIQEPNNNYVANDIIMGNKEYVDLPHPKTVMLDVDVSDGHNICGVLLYGINSSGKSSLMRSIGIAVVMAQSGFFVSANSMKFAPFESLFTRIVSKDNPEQGVSTFALEMLELKNIFKRACIKSLVLGDEIAHGTETLSSVAIVASAVIKLKKIGGLFLFATHLHQLSTMQEVQKLNGVINLHLSVKYNNHLDKLIFDRILQKGSGSSIYGLEFAKSLHMDKEFLETASQLRLRLSKELETTNPPTKKQPLKKETTIKTTLLQDW